MSPLGRYPASDIRTGEAIIFIRDDIAFSVVATRPKSDHGLSDEHTSDLEIFSLEEIKFLTSLTLSLHPRDGMVTPYPLPLHIDLPAGDKAFADDGMLVDAARSFAASAAWSDYDQSGATLPPLLGGPSWSRHPEPLDLARLTRLLDGLNLKDWLPLRGLGALLRADMLWQRREFAESADSDEAGHAFQSEAGHLFRREAGRCSDLKPATLGVVPLGQVG